MKKLKKEKLQEFVNFLLKEYDVFAPVDEDGIFSFKKIENFYEINLEYRNSKKPPKEIFFPQEEVMFEYRKGEVKSTEKVERKRAILGIRPCDVKALFLLDNVFAGEDYEDVYYVNKRKNTLLIGISCNNPSSTCFCTLFGSGPFSKEGLDVFLVDIGESFLVEPVSYEGKKTVKGDFFEEAKEDEIKIYEKIKKEAEEKVNFKVELKKIKEKLEKIFDNPIWDKLSRKCIGCGVCAYLCPTCHCFDIQDEARNMEGKRVRNWDSCMFPSFTLQASGHNPRPSKKERLRQRIMHKFCYFVENYKEFACVGCGRCILNCPVNMDIRENLKMIIDL